ncbi:hypothetical protein MAKP2_09820, partial [Klebsiella pneumoniae subsp. pneumoniae]
GGGSRYRPR